MAGARHGRPAPPPYGRRAVLVGALVHHHRALIGIALALLGLSCAWFALALLRPGGSPVLGWLPGLVAAPMAAGACWATAAVADSPAVARFWRQFPASAVLLG